MASIPFTGRTERSKDSWHWALPLLPIAISVFLLSALTWQRTQGDLGDGLLPGLVVGMSEFLGFQPAFMLCLLVMAWSSIWFFSSRIEKPGSRVLKILALTLCLSILVSLKTEGVNPEQGGILGRALAGRLMYVFGYTFTSLLVAVVGIAFFLLSTDFFFYSYFEGIGRDAKRSQTSLDDEGVETATVQAFESLAAKSVESSLLLEPRPLVRGKVESGLSEPEASEQEAGELSPRERRAAMRRRAPRGRPTQVIEEDPLDRVFPGPLETTVAEQAVADEPLLDSEDLEIAALAGLEDDVEDIRVIERPASTIKEEEPVADVTADFEIAVAEISEGLEAEEEEELEDEAEFEDEEDEEEYEEEEEEEGEEEEEYEEDEEEAEEEEEEEDEEEDEDEDEEEYEEEEDEEDEEEYEEVGFEEEEEESPEEEAVELVLDAGEEEEEAEEEEEDAEEAEELAVEPTVLLPRPRRHPKRQGNLFPSAEGDGNLVDEAARLVIANDRASASFLRRRLRISRQEALGVIEALSQEGVVDCDAGASQGRVIMDLAQWESR